MKFNYREGDEQFGRDMLSLESAQKTTENEPTIIVKYRSTTIIIQP